MFWRFDAKQLNRGIKYSYKIKNLQYITYMYTPKIFSNILTIRCFFSWKTPSKIFHTVNNVSAIYFCIIVRSAYLLPIATFYSYFIMYSVQENSKYHKGRDIYFSVHALLGGLPAFQTNPQR